jgi:hypothetical protein
VFTVDKDPVRLRDTWQRFVEVARDVDEGIG